jgi:hypothetical protein
MPSPIFLRVKVELESISLIGETYIDGSGGSVRSWIGKKTLLIKS